MNRRITIRQRWREAATGYALAAALAWTAAAWPPPAASAEGQGFATPEDAVQALMNAVRSNDVQELQRLFGPQGDKLVVSGDPVADHKARQRFAKSYADAHRIEREGAGTAQLIVGKRQWPFPIPLVAQSGTWRFDTTAGEQRILDRRIGRNELSAIQVCRTYVEAQREYASRDRNGDGWLEYASRFRSSPGRQDGLYWPVTGSAAPSPLGPLMVSAEAEGYGQTRPPGHRREPYHGYYYRILTRQGKDAPGGARDYMVRGHMIGGFALVAFPARYGASGVMSFIVDQDGVVYQKDLGRDTSTVAREMVAFDPDKTWTVVQ